MKGGSGESAGELLTINHSPLTNMKITGVIFSDLGKASTFMSLDWVQKALREKLGFSPYPATLNLRLESEQEVLGWKEIRKQVQGIDLPPADDFFCHARLFPVEIEDVAPVHVKKSLGLRDGQSLTLKFLAG